MLEQMLTFVRMTGERSTDNHLLAEYRCSCGNLTVVRRSRVKNGYTRSCGCLALENKPGLTHGQRGSLTYSSWRSMRQRCLSKTNKDYSRWGGRGITVCDRWASFENFLSDMGERPSGTTIDRIDPDGNYEPGNCRWATALEQARNRSCVVQVRTERGVELLVDVASRLGLTRGAAHLRLKRGKLEGVAHV